MVDRGKETRVEEEEREKKEKSEFLSKNLKIKFRFFATRKRGREMDWKELEKIFVSWNKCMTGIGGMGHGVGYDYGEIWRKKQEKEEKKREEERRKENERRKREFIEEVIAAGRYGER